MPTRPAHPTPYAEVNAVPHALLAGARWAELIERASAWRHDAPALDLSGAAAFVRFTLGRARPSESSEATR